MDLQLNNKVALVFGASAGLGGAIAETLAAEGARIALASLPSDSLTAAAERVGDLRAALNYAGFQDRARIATIKVQLDRQAGNALRQPVITDKLQQTQIVRPRILP